MSEQPDERASDQRIADAVDRLDSLDERPPAEHVEVYDEVHAVLQDALAEAQADQRDHGDPADQTDQRDQADQAPGGAAR